MERFTKRNDDGTPELDYPKSCYNYIEGMYQVEEILFRRKAIERLAEYEDTDLSPKEIMELKFRSESCNRRWRN